MTNNESGLNVNKPIQIPAWALVLLLGGGGSWLTWREIQGGPSDAAFAATPERHNCAEDVRTDVVSLKAEVSGLKAQVSQMDARLARIEDALINKR